MVIRTKNRDTNNLPSSGKGGGWSSVFFGYVCVLFLMTLPLPPALANITTGLVGWWKLNEGTGTNAADSSGNANTGTLTNGPTWVAGKIGQGLVLNGTNSYIATNQNVGVSGKDASVSMWFKTPAVSAFDTKIMLELSPNINGSNAFYISFNDNSGGTPPIMGGITAAMNSATYSVLATNKRYDDGLWHHLGVVFDRNQATAADQTSIYIDGVKVATSVVGGWNYVHTTSFTDDKFYIGARSGGNYTFNGAIDDVRIYNRALSAGDVTELYQYRGLVGHWSLDENTGTTAHDTSGNANDGTLVNSPSWVAGKQGAALSFNGSSSYVLDANSAASLNLTNDVTMAAWIYPNNYNGGEQTILQKGIGVDNSQYAFNIKASSGGQIAAYFYGISPYPLAVSTATVSNNNWYHIVVTFTHGSSAKIYINGVLDTTVATAGSLSSYSSTNVSIGAFKDTSNVQFFQGKIDDVRIYDHALTPNEVRELYSTRPVLVGHWKFDEGTGTSAADSSGYGNTGTLHNGPAWSTGYFNGALSFDGSDDYVSATIPTVTAPYSISLWYYPKVLGANGELISLGPNGGSVEPRLQYAYFNKLNFEAGAGKYINSSKVFDSGDLNKWFHVVITVPSSDVSTWNFYINGVTNNGASSNTGGYADPSTTLWIGQEISGQYVVNGSIDDVRIYDRALTPEQVAQIYNQPPKSAVGGGRIGGGKIGY